MSCPPRKCPSAVTSVPGNKQALLRVARAAPKDVGRGLARLNRADMEHLGVTVGDMVTVTCRERATVLKVMSLVGAKGGQRHIQMDGVARENVGARLDDRVAVELAEVADAQAVTLTTIGAALPPHAQRRRSCRAAHRRSRGQGRRARERQYVRLPGTELRRRHHRSRRLRGDHPGDPHPDQDRARPGRQRPRRGQGGVSGHRRSGPNRGPDPRDD